MILFAVQLSIGIVYFWRADNKRLLTGKGRINTGKEYNDQSK